MKNYVISLANIIDKDDLSIPMPEADQANNALQNILSTTFAVFAAIAVLVVSIGALKMVLSRGNPQEVAKARDTIIYASIGLVISMSAYIIVDFVIGSV